LVTRTTEGSGSEVVHVVELAIGGVFAVEIRPVPGRNAGLDVAVVGRRVVPDAVDLIGIADLVDAAFWRLLHVLRGLGQKAQLGAAAERQECR
jgi:hypothetical protein